MALLFDALLLFFCFLARSAAFRRDRLDVGLASTSAAVIRRPVSFLLPFLDGQKPSIDAGCGEVMGDGRSGLPPRMPAGRRRPPKAAVLCRLSWGAVSMSDEARSAH